jgi:5-methylcytosine-specific restriction protein A
VRDQRSPEAQRYRHHYNSARWKGANGVRARQLRKQPLCEMCLKAERLTPATVCDHVDPNTKLTAFFDGPFQSLCKPHHDSGKQREERSGFSGEADDDGWPTDPRHPANRRR